MQEYIYKTELHAHTSPASVCGDFSPRQVLELYSKLSYTSIALTNHFKFDGAEDNTLKINALLKDYEDAQKLSEKYNINVIFAAELRFNEGNSNDYLVYGIEPCEMDKIATMLGGTIEDFYRQYKSDNNIIIQAHPFRNKNEPAEPEFVDGIEVFNLHPNHNSRIGLAAKWAKKCGKIITAGTDFHHEGQHALCAMLTKAPVTNSFELAEVLKSRDYLLDISGITVCPY
ncbi:MAG: hypothetical protein UHH95_00095 [Oscillospiraceae bacterium]|nr:hypothetical protein [Oscillospiraceae bacterium]